MRGATHPGGTVKTAPTWGCAVNRTAGTSLLPSGEAYCGGSKPPPYGLGYAPGTTGRICSPSVSIHCTKHCQRPQGKAVKNVHKYYQMVTKTANDSSAQKTGRDDIISACFSLIPQRGISPRPARSSWPDRSHIRTGHDPARKTQCWNLQGSKPCRLHWQRYHSH